LIDILIVNSRFCWLAYFWVTSKIWLNNWEFFEKASYPSHKWQATAVKIDLKRFSLVTDGKIESMRLIDLTEY
jgi:hypothetical protein